MEPRANRSPLRALGPGLAGALAITVIHESARQVMVRRTSRRWMRRHAIRRSLRLRPQLGGLLSRAAYYAMVAMGRPERPYVRGLALGAAAGLAAVIAPMYLRRSEAVVPGGVSPAMTFACYLSGGLVAASVTRSLK